MRAGGSPSIEGVSCKRFGVIRRGVAGAVQAMSRSEAGDGPVVMVRTCRRVQGGTAAIGIGRLRARRILCFGLWPLAFSGRVREELGETRAGRASHGEKGCLLPLPTSSNHHLWCPRC